MSKQINALNKKQQRPPCGKACRLREEHAHRPPEHAPHSPEHLLADFFRRPPIPMLSIDDEKWLEPDIEISDTPKEVVVSAEMPGINPDEIQVNVSQDGYLTVSGEKQHRVSQNDEQSGAYFSEFSYGTMLRTIPLPPDLDYDSASASFENGVLSVFIPKTPESTRKIKKVPVQKK